MKTAFYRLIILLLRLFSLLPLSVLYLFSSFISFIFNNIYSYRGNIVNENLTNCFPEKSPEEISEIRKKFYRFFTDMLVESVKMFGMKPERLAKRIWFKNPEYLQELYDKNKSVIVISAHYGNWEWTVGLTPMIPHHAMAVYKPLNNSYFDNVMNRLRSSFNAHLVSMREIPKVLFGMNRKGTLTLSGFISDQSPVWEEIQYWTSFMGQLTPVYLGPEKLARKFDIPVVYFRMRRESRGKYSVEIVPVSDHPKETREFEITDKHVQLLEEDIRQAPEFWLWSHRRWKLTRKREREEAEGKFRFEGPFKRKAQNV